MPSVLWHCRLGGRKGIRPVKNGRWRWALVSPDGVAPSRMVSVSASVNLPLHHKAQKFSSGTGLPDGPGKRTVKRLWWYKRWSVNLQFFLTAPPSEWLVKLDHKLKQGNSRHQTSVPVLPLVSICPFSITFCPANYGQTWHHPKKPEVHDTLHCHQRTEPRPPVTTITTVLRPFVRDYPGEPVPEEITHSPFWSLPNLYQLLPSTTIHSILPVETACLAIFFAQPLSMSSLVYLLVWSPPPHIQYR